MDSFTFILCLLFVWTCIRVLTSGIRKKVKSGSGKLPPGPFPIPVVGSLFKIGNKPHESFAELAKTYGPLMTVKLGCVTTVVVSSPSMAKEVLQKNDKAFANRRVPDAVQRFNYHEASIVWSPASNHWRNLRRICNTEMFSSQRLDANQGLRRQKVQDLLAYARDMSHKGCAIDIGKASFATTLNLISNTMFSVNVASHNSKSVEEFKTIVFGVLEGTGKPNLADYFPVLRPIDPQGIRRRMTIYFGKLREFLDGVIDQRLQSRASLTFPSSNRDLLDTLLDLIEKNGLEFGRNDIRTLLMDIFLAGSDTSSNTVEWAMAELIHNPDTMAKARLELHQTIDKDKPVEESDITRLPYLQAVVKETMRLHPPAPLLIPHTAETDVEICGFTVPKHARVLVNTWAISRDPSIWVNPSSFMPERFLGSSRVDFRGQDFQLIPFGSGRRICPGLPLALRMVHLMLASLLYSFDWKLEGGMAPQDMSMADKFGLTLQKLEPLRAIPLQGSL